MPGLFGLISRQRQEICSDQLRIMLASMKYEAFFHWGLYINPDCFIYIGWTCHRNSFCDCLPITNQTGDLTLFFSGEVYGKTPRISASGIEDKTSDARQLLNQYEESGEKFFEELNGWFCGLLLDMRARKVFLFNDRYGMHRLFVHEAKEGLYFASEAKALLAILPHTREFDTKGLGEFVSCGCTLGTNSLYKGIRVLPPGSLWTLVNLEVLKKSFVFDHTQWTAQHRVDE